MLSPLVLVFWEVFFSEVASGILPIGIQLAFFYSLGLFFGPSQQPNMRISSASSDPNKAFSSLSVLFFSSNFSMTSLIMLTPSSSSLLADDSGIICEQGYGYVNSLRLAV